jgi:endonuclease/exonuclease/phosphatase (EEP) superfamily protein YafD
VASALALLYLVAYCCWRLLLLTPLYEVDWRLPLSQVLGSWFYLPLLPLLALAALGRSRLALALLATPLLFFAGEYGGQFLPRWLWLSQTHPEATVVRVMSWNMHYAPDRTGEFRALLAQQQPDLVALQEVSFINLRILAGELAHEYPYQQTAGPGAAGLAILSRYPFLAGEAGVRVMGCRCMEVVLDIDGQQVTVLNAHVESPAVYVDRSRWLPRVTRFEKRQQRWTFDALLAHVTTIQGPLIVLGDLNTTERQPNYQRLNRLLSNAHARAGWGMGYTFPTNIRHRGISIPPFVRIDHIFYSDAWQSVTATSGRLVESDHAYVMADLVLLEHSLNTDFTD